MATSLLRKISECFIKPKTKVSNDIFPIFYNGYFYSLAGQFETQVDEENRTSIIFIDCNKGPGPRFIHASLDLPISELLSPTHRPEAGYLMFDHNDAINHNGHTLYLLTVQVTELTDGVFIACSMNHSCTDGLSFWNFVNTFSEIFIVNGHEMTPISRPPVYNPWFLDGSGPIKLPFTNPQDELVVQNETLLPFKERVFHFSVSSIARLKAKENSECGTTKKVSSFQVLAAFGWRRITRARSVPEDENTRCSVAINCRRKLSPPLSQYYFGSSVDSTAVIATAGELLRQSIGWAAMSLNEAIASHNVRATAEEWMKNPQLHPSKGDLNPYPIMYRSSSRFDMYGPQFGMGKAFAIIEGKMCSFDGKVMCCPGRDEEGSVDVYVRLNANSLSALERDDEFLEVVSLFV